MEMHGGSRRICGILISFCDNCFWGELFVYFHGEYCCPGVVVYILSIVSESNPPPHHHHQEILNLVPVSVPVSGIAAGSLSWGHRWACALQEGPFFYPEGLPPEVGLAPGH